jgi:peptidoglycan/LPS O-acetylase OafA/YrhL
VRWARPTGDRLETSGQATDDQPAAGFAQPSRGEPAVEVILTRDQTIQDEIQRGNGATAGFDYLRLGLALAVLVWHSIILTSGSAAFYRALWSGPFRFLAAAILPMFFALSGFLVTGSLVRTRLHQFVTLRVLRLAPALTVEVTLSALILGALFTRLPLRDYLTNPELGAYFGNILGLVHFTLPGVFEQNPVPRVVNSQLWTIPFELECYASLAIVSLSLGLRRRGVFVALLVLFSLAATAGAFVMNSISPFAPPQGRVLVVAFLAGVAVHLYRDRIPYSSIIGVVAALASMVLLQIPNTAYLAAFPVAYLAAWIGLMRPPRIPFGDLSYGVYLFHFPVEQTIAHLFPGVGCWWLMTLMALPPTVLCAWLSWNLIEQPILSRKKRILARVDRAHAELARAFAHSRPSCRAHGAAGDRIRSQIVASIRVRAGMIGPFAARSARPHDSLLT